VCTEAFCPERVVETRECRVKLLVSMLLNVNFTETFVILAMLCAVKSVCPLARGTTTGSDRRQFVSPVVVVPY
jgi:hypothetical protein